MHSDIGNISMLTAFLQKRRWCDRAVFYDSLLVRVSVNRLIEDPKASVIVICWQASEDLIQTLRSLNNQTRSLHEIILINNGIPDGNLEAVFPLVHTYISLRRNCGAYIARNIGAVFAVAPILVFLDDDAVVNRGFVAAHLEAFNKYDIISLRGRCIPRTANPLNERAKNHYDLGVKPFPVRVNLEGNCSFAAGPFFQVGGWSDEIIFGHGGPELCYRLTKAYPNRCLQIYYPKAVIYHDYAKNEEHLQQKRAKQKQSLDTLKRKYSDWNDFNASWLPFKNKSHLIKPRNNTARLEAILYRLQFVLKTLSQKIKN
jgi:GT2 family glycosyltransferase